MSTSSLFDCSIIDLQLFECGREVTIPQKIFHFTPKNYYLIHYVIDGEGVLNLNSQHYSIKKNQAFVFLPHSNPEYHPDPLHPWTYIWIGFSGPLADKYLKALGVDEKAPTIDDHSAKLAPIFEAIYQNYLEYGRLGLPATALFMQIIAESSLGENTQDSKLTKSDRHFLAAKAFIDNNYQFKITIEDIAKNVNLTTNYLTLIFKNKINLTPKRYLIDFRMEKARALLETGRFTIKQIALMVGYEKQLHFSSEFKKNIGYSPLNYYKEHVKNHE